MYERTLNVPRLVSFYGPGETLPDPALETIRVTLSTHYRAELGEPFCTVGLCLYRDGRDSVAWHGDRIGRSRTEDTVVAIVSLAAPSLPVAPERRWSVPTVRARKRRPLHHGRKLSTHVGALCAEGRPPMDLG